jgi:hypothetical protein
VLPNSTGITLDQNFCGFTPTPSTLCPGGVCVIASDNSGAAGPNHYFQAENFSAVIFDKTGQVVLGPFSTATFWSGFTSPNNTFGRLKRHGRAATTMRSAGSSAGLRRSQTTAPQLVSVLCDLDDDGSDRHTIVRVRHRCERLERLPESGYGDAHLP